ncbi:MAG: energy-coupling factor transporter transmembrane protein EcfT [Clostridia bacterium]|nr:energy-coupling factor transporter transmembrane protein EcfT [Clostridia bacterium]
MSRRNAFSDCHPVVNLLYFGSVLAFTMFTLHPLCLTISLLGALCCAACVKGRETRALCLSILPIVLLAALFNPLFNHEGMTLLLYLPSGNPLTLESIAFGLSAAAMLAAAVLWFSCCSAVITSDKFLYLFGRIAPALSLLLSMTLRFVPLFIGQLKTVTQARKGLYAGAAPSKGFARAKLAIASLSSVTTWALEHAVETADSMKSRGYGLPGRTAFSLYRLDRRDKALLAWLSFCGLYVLSGCLAGGMAWRYYPTMKGVSPTPLAASFFFVYLLLCLTPLFLELWERRLFS